MDNFDRFQGKKKHFLRKQFHKPSVVNKVLFAKNAVIYTEKNTVIYTGKIQLYKNTGYYNDIKRSATICLKLETKGTISLKLEFHKIVQLIFIN